MKPDLKKVTYEAALTLTWEMLDSRNLQEVARISGAPYNADKDEFELEFLGDIYYISPSKRTVLDSDRKDVFSFLAVLLLHYLVHVKDMDEEGRLISFTELSGGDVYYSAFCRRAINPITEAFGSDLEAMRRAGEALGAQETERGDISLKITAFPKVPVTVIIWMGDEEVSASSNMIFDASIAEHLPTEDVAVIGGFVASKLVKNLKKKTKNKG